MIVQSLMTYTVPRSLYGEKDAGTKAGAFLPSDSFHERLQADDK